MDNNLVVALFTVFASANVALLVIQLGAIGVYLLGDNSPTNLGSAILSLLMIALAVVHSIGVAAASQASVPGYIGFGGWSILYMIIYGILDRGKGASIANLTVQSRLTVGFLLGVILVMVLPECTDPYFTTTRIIVWVWSTCIASTMLFASLTVYRSGKAPRTAILYAFSGALVLITLAVNVAPEAWITMTYMSAVMLWLSAVAIWSTAVNVRVR